MGSSSLNSKNVSASTLAFNVPLGNVPGVTSVLRTGFNGVVNGTAEDVWNAGGQQVYLISAETMDLVSDDANDTSAGSGAQTVLVDGLDANFDEIQEIVSMDGVTPVTTTSSFLRIHRLVTATAGATGSNEGVITITSTSSVNIQGQMEIGLNSSSTFQYTVPNAKTALLTSFTLSTGSADQTDFSFFTRLENSIFILANENQVIGNVFDVELLPYQAVAARTDMRVLTRQIAGGGTVSVTAILQMYLVDD